VGEQGKDRQKSKISRKRQDKGKKKNKKVLTKRRVVDILGIVALKGRRTAGSRDARNAK